MARGVNKVILIGRLGRDPEVRYTPSGTAVANVSVATNEVWKDKQTGENQERTEWHRVVFFARLAEIVSQYLKKGANVYVEGRLQTKKWQDKDGQDRYTTEIIANELQMLDSKAGASSMQGADGFEESMHDHQPQSAANTRPSVAPAAMNNDLDDDIPF